jgi:biotin carboxylase
VALDDFDLELAATLREHLRIPGMGETQVRFFRDKLAMRMGARSVGINVPEFVGVFNYDRIREFMSRVPPPWVLKPRSMAGAIGIKKIHSSEEFWSQLEVLGDMQSHYLLEQFVPGDVFHVDTLIYQGKFLFAIASGYGRPPMEVSHGGGVFTTRTLERDHDLSRDLLAMNQSLLTNFGLLNGASHTEFIRAHRDNRLYFLETSARVGGAHIADLVEAATGINLWAEWARILVADGEEFYHPPEPREDYAGLLVSLARQEHPDTSAYNDAEIVWRMNRPHHVGLIVKSASSNRVSELLESYIHRIQQDFGASLPPLDKPSA